MKRFLVLGFAAFAAVTLSAKSLVFTIDEGLLVYYLIGGEKNPVMTFTQDGVVVNTDAYEFSRIRNFYISETDDPAAIRLAGAERSFAYDGGRLVLKSCGKSVRVCKADGTPALAEVTAEGDVATVDFAGCGKGVYVVSVGNVSFKVQKK